MHILIRHTSHQTFFTNQKIRHLHANSQSYAYIAIEFTYRTFIDVNYNVTLITKKCCLVIIILFLYRILNFSLFPFVADNNNIAYDIPYMIHPNNSQARTKLYYVFFFTISSVTFKLIMPPYIIHYKYYKYNIS